MTFISHGPLGTCRGPQDHRKIFFFRILIDLASLHAEFDADSEFEIKIQNEWNFGREKPDLLEDAGGGLFSVTVP